MLLFLLACGADEPSAPVPLRWTPSTAADAWEDARRGVDWQLANLGAFPPADGSHLVETAVDDAGVRFTLDLPRAGFTGEGLAALEEVAATAAIDPETTTFGAMEVGRFFLRSLYEPAVYYRATGACPTRAEWESLRFDGVTVDTYGVTRSSVAYGERLLTLTPWRGRFLEIAVSAEEGEGSLVEGSFVGIAIDTVDVLPNGQYRYATYDPDGRLVGAADPERSEAGPPGRCQWCHEDHLDTYLLDNDPVPGSLDTREFLSWAERVEEGQAGFQATLGLSLDIADSEVHAHGERLTEGWLFPTPGRLAREWGADEADVRAWLADAGAPLEVNPEYPDDGEVTTREAADAVYRAEIDAGWAPFPTRASAREATDADLLPIEGLSGC